MGVCKYMLDDRHDKNDDDDNNEKCMAMYMV